LGLRALLVRAVVSLLPFVRANSLLLTHLCILRTGLTGFASNAPLPEPPPRTRERAPTAKGREPVRCRPRLRWAKLGEAARAEPTAPPR
jgi:hypothetical protein